MKLHKVAAGWYETADGRYVVVRSKPTAAWSVARIEQDGQWVAEMFPTKRDAVANLARRLTFEEANA